MTPKERTDFRKIVRTYYRKHGRTLPWRETTDPYKILVSELMLQQTQAPRVAPKFNAFIKKFPTVQVLAKTPLGDVLSAWQGLGYNRRAKYLWEAAQRIVNEHEEQVPESLETLKSLPGIGPYTATAIRSFAFNAPEIVIETNIRAVYIHHFFKDRQNVSDQELIPPIQETLDGKNPRDWYNALMDYGAFLKETLPNPSRRSTSHQKQSTFKGSKRELRGAILRELNARTLNKEALSKKMTPLAYFSPKRFDTLLHELINEKLISKKGSLFQLG